MGEHGEDPGNGVKVRDEADLVQVVEQFRIVECLEMGKLCEIFLDDDSIVLHEHVVEVLGDEGRETSPCQCFIIEV